MGCRCGGNKKHQIKPPEKPKSINHVMGQPVVKTIAIDAKFCQKCGWMMAKIGYIDIQTKKKIHKYTCPNRKCTAYNK